MEIFLEFTFPRQNLELSNTGFAKNLGVIFFSLSSERIIISFEFVWLDDINNNI